MNPTPMRQEIAWILAHKYLWPKEVTLVKQAEFSISNCGDLGCFVLVSAGTKAKVIEIARWSVTVELPHGQEELPHEATDLITRVRVLMENAESQEGTVSHSGGLDLRKPQGGLNPSSSLSKETSSPSTSK